MRLKDREIARRFFSKYLTIGRDESNDLVIDNIGISRRHVTISTRADHVLLQDAGSSNGVFLQGEKVSATPVRFGEVFQLGKFSCEVRNVVGTPESESPRSAGTARNPMQTLVMAEDDMSKLVAAQHLSGTPQEPASEPTKSDGAGADGAQRTLLIGFCLVFAIGLAGFLLLTV